MQIAHTNIVAYCAIFFDSPPILWLYEYSIVHTGEGAMLHLLKYLLLAVLLVSGLALAVNAIIAVQYQPIPAPVAKNPAELLALECTHAEMMMKQGRYAEVRRALTRARAIARESGLTLPASTAALGVPSAKLRLAEIESEMNVAYHEYYPSVVVALGSEAITLAKEDGVYIPDRIMEITSKMRRGYLEPFYQGRPLFIPKPMDT